MSPWIAPIEDERGEIAFSPSLSSVPTNEPATKTPTTSVEMTPFTLSLQTSPLTNTVDSDELGYLVSSHLLKEMQARFTSVEATKVDVDLSLISSRRLQQTGLVFLGDMADPKEHAFAVNGKTYFEGSTVPTLETIDIVTQESFGDEFVRSLQFAEDAGLQSTSSVSVDMSSEPASMEENKMVESYLGSNHDDPIVSSKLYFLAIFFGVGFLLVAMYVMKTQRARKIELENERTAVLDDIIDEESQSVTEFPKYIEVENKYGKSEESMAGYSDPRQDTSCSIFGSIREALTDEPEVEPYIVNASDMSALTQPTQSQTQSQTQAQPLSEDPTFISIRDDIASQGSQSKAMGLQAKTLGLQSKTKVSTSGTQPNVEASDLSVKSLASSKNMSVFPSDLPSISEASDGNSGRNQEVNKGCGLWGGYSQPLETQTRVTGSFWGEKPDDVSSKSSQSQISSPISVYDARTSDTCTVTTQGTCDQRTNNVS